MMITGNILKLKSLLTSGHSRSISLKVNIAALFALRGFSILITFLIVPLTIDYLEPSEYGIWLTLSSLLMWVDFLDIGIGHGLRNKLTEAFAKQDYSLAKSYVSTTFAFLGFISLLIFGCFYLLNFFINWAEVLNINQIYQPVLNRTMIWLVGLFCLRFVSKTIGTILSADQKPSGDTLLSVISNLLSIVVIFILTKTTQGSIEYVAIACSATPPLVFIIASFTLFRTTYKAISPTTKAVQLRYVKGLLGLGIKFFIIQLSCLLIFSSSNFLIIRWYTPSDVTAYNIAYKYYNIVMMLFVIMVTPLWSAFTDAYVKNDLEWIKKTIKSFERIWYWSVALTIILILFSDLFYTAWIGKSVHVPFSITIALAIYTIVYNLLSTYNYVINGTGKILIQTIHAGVSIIIYLPLTTFLSRLWGISGIISASTIILLPLIVCSYIQCKKIMNGTASGIWNR